MSTPYCSHTYTNIRYCSLYNYGYSQCSSYGCQYNRLGLKCYGMNDILSNFDLLVVLMLFYYKFQSIHMIISSIKVKNFPFYFEYEITYTNHFAMTNNANIQLILSNIK